MREERSPRYGDVIFIFFGKKYKFFIYVNPHGKNDFAEVFKNLARYRTKNNSVL